MKPEQVVLSIPSIMGYEEVVAETVGTIARAKGFSFDKVSKLKTAVGESCLNAIEHGNKQDQTKQVVVTVIYDAASIRVSVRDFGAGNVKLDFSKPDLKKQIDEKQLGGWGMYLMHTLVDAFKAEDAPDGGTIITMTLHSS